MDPELLSALQRRMLISVCTGGSRIEKAAYFREEYLPCPIRVSIRNPDGSQRTLVLRIDRDSNGGVAKEIKLLPVLARHGLPVPEVLAGPEKDSDVDGNPTVVVYSFLPGETLQELSERSSIACQEASQLVVEAVERLAELTPKLQREVEPNILPEITLSGQLEEIVEKAGPWLREAEFTSAVEKLGPVLEGITDPTVFTNGDYQPANFLTDGKQVIGFIDFESASYQDFLFGFAKYPIYDLHPLNKGGMIALLLERKEISTEAFAIRLALGCLRTLQREIAVADGIDRYRAHVLNLLREALCTI